MRLSIVTVAAVALAGSVDAATISRNARCGVEGFGASCSGSKWGSCCSQHGWCGATSAYCGDGCQKKFGTCESKSQSSSVRSSIRPSAPISSATSSLGSSRTTSLSALPTKQPISGDARCGASFGNQTCKGSKWGDCCSQYFYCGRTDDYCKPESCQPGFGVCKPVSSSSRTSPIPSTTKISSSRISSVASSYVTSRVSSASLSYASSTASLLTVATTSITSSAISSVSTSTVSLASTAPTSSSALAQSSSAVSRSSIASSLSSIIASSAPAPTPSSSCSQLIANGDFETGDLSPWRVFSGAPVNPSFTVITEDASSTNHVVIYNARSGNGVALQQDIGISLPAGSSFSCSFRYRTVGTFASFKIYFDIGNTRCGQSFEQPTTFQTVTGSGRTAVDNPSTLSLFIETSTTEAIEVYIDDISLCATPSSSSPGSSSTALPSISETAASSSIEPSSPEPSSTPVPVPSSAQSSSSPLASSSTPNPSAPAVVQVIKNPGFETGGIENWNIMLSDEVDHLLSGLTASVSHSGSYSMLMKGSAFGMAGNLYQSVILEPQASYNIEFWAQHDLTDGGCAFTFSVNGVPMALSITYGEPFTRYRANAPAQGKTANNIELYFVCYTIDKSIWIDDITMTKVGAHLVR